MNVTGFNFINIQPKGENQNSCFNPLSVELTFAFVVNFSHTFAFFIFNTENNLQCLQVLTSVYLKKLPRILLFKKLTLN